MVVAPRTLDGQTQKRGSGRGDHVIEIVGALLEHPLDRLVADDVVRAADQEPGRRLRQPVGRAVRLISQGITGQLLADELRERRVAIERADHVIAIRPGGRPRQVGLVPLALAEPNDVQPVPPPALAVLRRGQQPIDERVHTRVGRDRGDKGVDVVRGRRKTGQIERDAADQGRRIGRRCRRQPVRIQTGQNKGIDRRLDPVGVSITKRGR